MTNPYPKNWKEISRQAIARRGYHCERCLRTLYHVPWLTTHHIDGNPANNDDDNLFVCCPKCHFFIDRFIYPARPTPLVPQPYLIPLTIQETPNLRPNSV